MSAASFLAPAASADFAGAPDSSADHYLVSHGRNGALASFPVRSGLRLERRQRVVLQTPRGLEAGEVRGPATLRQARLLAGNGEIVRAFNQDDYAAWLRAQAEAESVFERGRTLVVEHGWPLAIVDVEVSLEARFAIIYFLAATGCDLEKVADQIRAACSISILLENVAPPLRDDHGCGKADCGRNAGGCSTCGSEGGCSSCGSGKIDLRQIFGHLRSQLEQRRTPLL